MLYPGNIKKTYHKNILHANRGMNLEKAIDETHKYYLVNDIAIINKRPTPIAIKKTEYHNKKIKTTGFLKAKSTLDYVGIYKGKYLDFDAKSTLNKTAFPLSNIHKHQFEHINNIINHKGIAFLLIEMNGFVYLLKGEDLLEFKNQNQRKSIPYDYIKKTGHIIKLGVNPCIDYIKVINKIYFLEGEK